MPIRHPMSKLYYVMFFPLTQGSTVNFGSYSLYRSSDNPTITCPRMNLSEVEPGKSTDNIINGTLLVFHMLL